MAPEETKELWAKALLRLCRFCKEMQVRPICRGSEKTAFVHVKSFAYMVGNTRSCSCCKAYHALSFDFFDKSRNLQVVRTKCVSPLGYTVSFVNRN